MADLITEEQAETAAEQDGSVPEEERRPMIAIELKRLIGYPPSSQDVVDSIHSQLVEAMWSRYRQENSGGVNDDDEEEEDGDDLQSVENEEKERDSSASEPPRLPPDFDRQIQELLDARIARCGKPPRVSVVTEAAAAASSAESDATADTTSSVPLEYLVLRYPPKIHNPLAAASSSSRDSSGYLLDTAHAWNEIQKLARVPLPLPLPPLDDEDDGTPSSSQDDSPLAFLQKLTTHLINTGRTLTWKYAMANELRDILKQELLWKQHQEWTSTQRQAKLDSLYGVRETLVHQTEIAQLDVDRLLEERDKSVSQELMVQYQQLERKEQQHRDGGASVLPSAADLDLCREFQLLGMMPHEEEFEEDEDAWGEESLGGGSIDDDYSSDGSGTDQGDDDDSLIGNVVDVGDSQEVLPKESNVPEISAAAKEATLDSIANETEATAQTESQESQELALILPFQRRQERRKRAKERKRKERLEAEQEAKREKLKALQEQLRTQYTTRELILAQTMLNALEKKVENVDELLENLQDEVWAAEEEEEEQATSKQKTTDNSTSNNDASLSLLDQVLAMILGALPTNPGMTPQQQYQFAKSEHGAIAKGWKDYFGRLPPAVIAGRSQEEEDVPDAAQIVKANEEPTMTPEEQREALGIVDNDDEEWDAGD
ncbi:MAG: hypothetical protein SGILL_004440 [Bacillariaceae sp.]